MALCVLGVVFLYFIVYGSRIIIFFLCVLLFSSNISLTEGMTDNFNIKICLNQQGIFVFLSI